MKENETIQVKSKERVKDFGEVFTNPREVKAMLDLVKDESYRIDSKFLEPACGNGNFLIEILARKLQTVNKTAKSRQEWELLTLVGLGSIYAIDIQADNVEESRERLLVHIKEVYKEKFGEELSSGYLSALNEVLAKNIIHGDGLTGLQHGKNVDKEILFSEWSFDNWLETGEVVRKDFSMNEMIAHNKRIEAAEKITSQAGSLFSLAPQEVKKEELQPVHIKKYANFYKGESFNE